MSAPYPLERHEKLAAVQSAIASLALAEWSEADDEVCELLRRAALDAHVALRRIERGARRGEQ